MLFMYMLIAVLIIGPFAADAGWAIHGVGDAFKE